MASKLIEYGRAALHALERDDSASPTRRDFSVGLVALLMLAGAPRRVGARSRSQSGRWVLNERDR